jgi:Mrp family chromosome partitioning ATPase
MAECTHDCSSCGVDCPSKTGGAPKKEAPNELSNIKKVIGIVSGKGGVGKSMVTSLLAVAAQRQGYKSAILDADITGPSIGKAFGIHEKAVGNELGILPIKSKTGINLMSVNFLLPEETDPVVWRGAMISNAVKQFWTDVIWGDVDFMFIDMPPGTGDVALTVFQSICIDGIIIVASPQEQVSMIVEKAVKMAGMMPQPIPVLGIVENMSYVVCPTCGEKINVFGESRVDALAAKYNLPILARMPIDPKLAKNVDMGVIELYEGDYMDKAMEMLEQLL